MSTTLEPMPNHVLHDHFPRVSTDCKVPAQTFFSCFSTGSMKSSSDDKNAGIRGISSCLNEKKAYDSCMFGWEKKFPSKRYRVQDEYRQAPSIATN